MTPRADLSEMTTIVVGASRGLGRDAIAAVLSPMPGPR